MLEGRTPTAMAVRGAIVAALCAVLVLLVKFASISMSSAVVTGMGMAAGIGFASVFRRGTELLVGVLVGVGVALWIGGTTIAVAAVATCVTTLGLAALAYLMRLTAFGWRL